MTAKPVSPPASPWGTIVKRLRRLGTRSTRGFGLHSHWQPQPVETRQVFRPVAGSNARLRVMDGEFSPHELLEMERRRCVELQRENERLRYLTERLGLRVKILEQH